MQFAVASDGLVDTGIWMHPRTALTLAGAVGRYYNLEVTGATPMLECELPGNGSRFTALVPTVVSAPMVTIGERSLVQRTMRLRPDRIVVGEVRGTNTPELLKAWGTGHPAGAATIHAETAHGALVRL